MTDYRIIKDKKVFITGATGLIGRALVSVLRDRGAELVCFVRDVEKARRLIGDSDRINYVVGDMLGLPVGDIGADYAIHCAAQTSSKAFVERPAELITESIEGTRRMLEFARANNVKGMVYLSSMEVYGNPLGGKISETSPAYLDCTAARSSYPESKRIAECLCSAYCAEYGVPTKIVRLTQTFGPGVAYDDARVFAEFARCVIEERDIVLKTKGETERSYLYLDDAVDAILTVLVKGAPSAAYNAANEKTYCSIADMAHMVAEKFGNGKTKVRIEEQDIAKFGYAPTLKMDLDTTKLRALGWEAKTDLEGAFAKTIAYMREHVTKDR